MTPPEISGRLSSTKSPLCPPMVEFIDDHPALKPVVRVGLLPAVTMSTVATGTTSAVKIMIAGLFVLIAASVVVWTRRKALD